MKQAKKILVPTDFSENSRAGLRFGLSLAAENEAELVILHVASEFQAWEIPEEAGFLSSRVYTWEVDKIVKEATLDLHRFLEGHREDLGRVPLVRKRVVLGDVVEKIIAVAHEEQVDLIVMSPRPHGNLRRFLLGSVTDQVTREAPCPVLSVCPGQPENPWRGKLIRPTLFPLRQKEAGV
jgi:nucleotide-binding universal stress UspA family protein